jgi:catechol 2,3-dioxygenase-like lactoylglutathione lyase family enzyme
MNQPATSTETTAGQLNMRLELVPMPVSDVEQSLVFYRDKIGFHLDHDVQPGNGMRVVQLTPPGSACSIVFGVGISDPSVAAGSVRNLHLVVDDIATARQALLDRGVSVGEVNDMGGVLYAYFADPDGNSWALQEIALSSRP